MCGDPARAEAPDLEAAEQFVAEFIAADGGRHVDREVVAVQVIADVERRAAGKGAAGQKVPEHFAETDDERAGG